MACGRGIRFYRRRCSGYGACPNTSIEGSKFKGLFECGKGTLGDIGPEAIDAVPALTLASRDRMGSVSLYAAQALERIKKSQLEATDDADFDF